MDVINNHNRFWKLKFIPLFEKKIHYHSNVEKIMKKSILLMSRNNIFDDRFKAKNRIQI